MLVCLFDIDGTLLSSGGAGKAAMEAALGSAFGVVEIRGRVPFAGRTDRAIGRDLFRAHGIDESAANWQRFVQHYLEHLPACLGRHPGRVLPGIAGLLDHLRQRQGAVLGLLTGNLQQGARLKLGHYDLAHHFAFGGYGDHHWDRDDVARDALQRVHEYCNGSLGPEQLWVIGDTPLDVSCARAIGARVAAVATGVHSLAELEAARPDCLLADFSDPTPLLRLWS